eukprot:TRINITY_DN14140_c0_g1_i1.p1 TRINITY_DN14140_c0_g1~~TRINITY_DN14140_c0_g1_i1.p1  ORF type:complete len:567 (-),score=106.07 TRINITY_DN14140_c0_g1_i1:769-2469(-)
MRSRPTLALLSGFFHVSVLVGRSRAERLGDQTCKDTSMAPTCDFPPGATQFPMMRLGKTPLTWLTLRSFEDHVCDNLTVVTFEFPSAVSTYGGKCLTKCNVLDMGFPEGGSTCETAVLNAFGDASDSMQPSVDAIGVAQFGQYKLCCTLIDAPDEFSEDLLDDVEATEDADEKSVPAAANQEREEFSDDTPDDVEANEGTVEKSLPVVANQVKEPLEEPVVIRRRMEAPSAEETVGTMVEEKLKEPVEASLAVSASASKEGDSGTNQDRSLVWTNEASKFSFCGVFDGHGPKGPDGAKAAEAVRTFFEEKLNGAFKEPGNESASKFFSNMDQYWEGAHKKALHEGAGPKRNAGTTSTVVAAQSEPWTVKVWWAGDSTAKILSRTSATSESFVTEPHSCTTENDATAQWSKYSWYCSFGGRALQIVRTLGVPDVQHEPAFLDWSAYTSPGSVILIGSDGLWDAPMRAVVAQNYQAILDGKVDDDSFREDFEKFKAEQLTLPQFRWIQKQAAEWEQEHITEPLLTAGADDLQRVVDEIMVKARQAWDELNQVARLSRVDDITAVALRL